MANSLSVAWSSKAMFRLDRTRFHKGKLETVSQWQSDYWKSRPVEERFAAAWYLCSIAWQFDIENPPRLDKTKFNARKLGQ